MEAPIPPPLLVAANHPVLAYLHDKSAHGDLAGVLLSAVDPLGDVQLFCPDSAAYRYLVASTKGLIFGFATGMNVIAFRLDPRMKARALETGGEAWPLAGPEWVAVCRDRPDADWPAVDVRFWARKAYGFARESA